MRKAKREYRPPETDSEDEYDGFYFNDSLTGKKSPHRSHWVVDVEQELYAAVQLGDLEKVKQQVAELNFDVNAPVKCGFTLLLHACQEGHLDVAQYLVLERKANVNRAVDSYTPLMLACGCANKEPAVVSQLVKLLLEHGAVINVSDKYGTTPFMLACKNGYADIVRSMLKHVSYDSVDNNGYTAIFHAIEYNRAEVVRLLVDAGVNTTIANSKGYTPLQVVQFHGFYDLLNILPKEASTTAYMVPTKFLGYNTLRDYIPRIFLKSDCPEYFQEINSILLSIGMESFLEYFAKGRVSLATFLALDDAALSQLGIRHPIHRMKLLKGLLDFHLHHWSKKKIARVSTSKENFYEVLMLAANHLQHLVVLGANLRYLRQHLTAGTLGPLTREEQQHMQHTLQSYRSAIKDLRHTVKYLASFSPSQNPLYIEYDDCTAQRRRRSKIKSIVQYTSLIIGISVFICLKFRKSFG